MKQIASVALIAILATSVGYAKKHREAVVQHAPLPAKVLAAKTIYLQNESGRADIADHAYTELKTWGRYQIVDAKEKADLILVLRIVTTETQGTQARWVSLYNSQNQSYTSGSVPTPVTNKWYFTQWTLTDLAGKEIEWSDQRPWLKKHPATKELANSLRQRVEEQKPK